MTVYLTNEGELAEVADAIREKGGTSARLAWPTGYASAIGAIDAGGGPELIYSGTVTASTTSTSAASLTTISLGSSAWRKDKVLWVEIRDAAGPRAGYFYGSDNLLMNYYKANNATTSLTYIMRGIHRYTTSNTWNFYNAGTTTGYGVYVYSLSSSGVLTLYTRYNSTYSLTINGTYSVKVYALDWPSDNPFT